MVAPCALIFIYAFFERGLFGGIDFNFTLDNFKRVADPLYAGIFLNSAPAFRPSYYEGSGPCWRIIRAGS